MVQSLRAALLETGAIEGELKSKLMKTCKARSDREFLVVCCGKVSAGKNFETIALSIGELRRAGFDVTLAAIVGGSDRSVSSFIDFVEADSSIFESCIVMPFVVGISLEAGFVVKEHFSGVVREMMLSGLALVVSHELANRPFFYLMVSMQVLLSQMFRTLCKR